MEQIDNLKHNSKESLSYDIRETIDAYLKKENMTLQEFADSVGMSLRNVKDIVNNGRVPYVRNTISIFKTIFKKNTIEDILNVAPVSICNYIKESKFYSQNEILEDDTKIMLEYENNPVFALVYDLTVDSGVSSQDILKKFGEYGLSMAVKLTEYELIKKKNEYYVRTNKKLFRTTRASYNRTKNALNNFVIPEKLNLAGENILRNYTADLTESQYNEWLTILAKTYIQIESISQKETNEPKTIKAFTGIFADVMIRNEGGNYEN